LFLIFWFYIIIEFQKKEVMSMKKWILLLTVVAALSISLTAIAATSVVPSKATSASSNSQSKTLKAAPQSQPARLSSASTAEHDNEAKSTVDSDNIQQQVEQQDGPNVEQKGGPNDGPDTNTSETSSVED
jgi:maltose-binding protein MalE